MNTTAGVVGWLVLAGIVFLITRSRRWVTWMLILVPTFFVTEHPPKDVYDVPWVSFLVVGWFGITFVAAVFSIIRWLVRKPTPSKAATST